MRIEPFFFVPVLDIKQLGVFETVPGQIQVTVVRETRAVGLAK